MHALEGVREQGPWRERGEPCERHDTAVRLLGDLLLYYLLSGHSGTSYHAYSTCIGSDYVPELKEIYETLVLDAVCRLRLRSRPEVTLPRLSVYYLAALSEHALEESSSARNSAFKLQASSFKQDTFRTIPV